MKEEQRVQIKKKIVQLVGQGFTLKAVAKACGINRETIRRWRNTDAIFGCLIGTRLLQRQLDRFEMKYGKIS